MSEKRKKLDVVDSVGFILEKTATALSMLVVLGGGASFIRGVIILMEGLKNEQMGGAFVVGGWMGIMVGSGGLQWMSGGGNDSMGLDL